MEMYNKERHNRLKEDSAWKGLRVGLKNLEAAP
jgi:hypothetical protein